MLNELIQRYPKLKSMRKELEKAANMLVETYHNGGKVLVCGNGGSCADAEHIVGELMKGFLSKRKLTDDEVKMFEGYAENASDFASKLQRAIPAISLPSQCAILSAFINDVEPDMAYAQMTFGYGRKEDLLIGISTSGNSANVVNAVIAAKAIGMKTIGMTGSGGGRLSELCDCTLKSPETETFKVQEYHLPMYHFLCAQAEKTIFE